MKIIYKKPILEQIHAAIRDAKKRGVEIDHIHLTEKEGCELRKACHVPDSIKKCNTGSIMGVQFVIDEFDALDDVFHDLFKEIFGGTGAGVAAPNGKGSAAGEKPKTHEPVDGCDKKK